MEVWYDMGQDQLIVITNVSSTQCYVELLDNMGENNLGVMRRDHVAFNYLEYIGPLYGT
jgi:hypothetical protein